VNEVEPGRGFWGYDGMPHSRSTCYSYRRSDGDWEEAHHTWKTETDKVEDEDEDEG
jgi:hypothetical protein